MSTAPSSPHRAPAADPPTVQAGGDRFLHALVFAGTATLLLLVAFSPRWDIFAAWFRVPELTEFVEVRRGATVLQQLEAPLAPLTDPIHRVVQWRLLFPGLAHVLHLPPVVLLGLPLVGAWLALAFIWQTTRACGCTRLVAWCSLIICGSAGWFFTTTGWLGYFDSWLLIALLAVSHGRRHWALWSACLLAPWVDERFIIGLPLALLLRHHRTAFARVTDAGELRRRRLRELAIPLALAGLFVAIRLWLAGRSGSPGLAEYLGAQQTLGTPIGRKLLGLWESLRFAWPFVFAGALVFMPNGSSARKLAFAGVLVLTAAAGFAIANDLSRSMTLLLPLAVGGFCRLDALRAGRVKLITLFAAAALLIPARHVVTDFVLPIVTLPSVISAWRSPSGELAPVTWVARANAAIAAGRLTEGERATSIALRLNADFGPAYNARGFIAARQNRLDAALADFAKASALNPEEASFWFNYAFAARQLGRSADLSRALSEAKRRAPPDSDLARKIADFETGRLAP